MPEIYLTRNLINNKKYIGQSIHDNKNYLGSGTLLKQAIKKYGKENFEKRVIVSGDFNYNLLNDLELHYIRLYNADNSKEFYNLEQGGKNCGHPHTKEHKEFLRNWKDNPILKINSNPNKQREVIEKANNAAKLLHSKKVYEFDLQHNIIHTFNSVREASEFYNLVWSCVAKCCRKNSKDSIVCYIHNHIFSYKSEMKGKSFSEFITGRNEKRIVEYDETFKILKEFKSQKDACDYYNLDKGTLHRHLYKKNKKKNMNVMYLSDYEVILASSKK